MTTRADLIEGLSQTFWPQWVVRKIGGEDDPAALSEFLAAVVDVLLPQVSTVEQLEALPVGTKFVSDEGVAWRKPASSGFLEKTEGGDAGYWDPEDALSFGPLTVVWQPSVDRVTT